MPTSLWRRANIAPGVVRWGFAPLAALLLVTACDSAATPPTRTPDPSVIASAVAAELARLGISPAPNTTIAPTVPIAAPTTIAPSPTAIAEIATPTPQVIVVFVTLPPTTAPTPVLLPSPTNVASATPGGVVGGAPGGTGTRTLPPATPTSYVLPVAPPALPPGQDRFLFRIVDQGSGWPLYGVCVTYGFPCGPSDPHTNTDGWYWLDLNPGMATTWNFRFSLDNYLTANLNKTYRPGMGTSTTTVFLRHL
jgi:hypothetical protein